MPRLVVLLVLGSPLGCAEPPLEALDPLASEHEFRSRTLSDPGLRRFLEENLGEPLAEFPPAVWDLELLTLAAFYFHPDLDVARSRVEVVQAGIRTAGAWPNPTLGVDLERVTNPTRGVSPWVSGFSLTLPLDTLWKRGYRLEQAERQTDQAKLELGLAGWRVRSRLRAALLDHLLWLEEEELKRREEAARLEVSVAQRGRLAAGAVFRLDVTRAETELATTRAEVFAAAGQAAESLYALAQAIGVPPRAIQGLKLRWRDLEAPPDSRELGLPELEKVGQIHRLDLRSLQAEYEASLAALKLELAKRYPDLALAPGLLDDQGDRKVTLGLSLTLPILDQNQGPIVEADARRKEVAARYRALQADILGEVETGLVRYRQALAELGETRKMVGSLAEQQAAIGRAVELGAEDRVALTAIRLSGVVGLELRLAALRKAQAALGRLEDAVHRPLDTAGAFPEVPLLRSRTSSGPEGHP